MKFYDCATAPSPRRARMVIAEKRIDVETIEIDLRSGQQFSEDFRTVNPGCTVPAPRATDVRAARRTRL